MNQVLADNIWSRDSRLIADTLMVAYGINHVSVGGDSRDWPSSTMVTPLDITAQRAGIVRVG
jgi:hypothetical protein